MDEAEEQRKARDICYALLTARARSRQELYDALLRKEISPGVAEVVLGKFDRAGLIDDAQFAEMWVRSRHTYNGLGRRALVMELRRKGVADEVVAEAVAAVDNEAEEERARELVRKRLRTLSGVDETTKIRRLVGALARKGYAEGLAYRVVRDELRAAGAEASAMDEPWS
ncbi:regulatory protein RecX [Lentzea flaviverrucosa]|uniref:Regulatory protein RecX n=1 Tax=Lentzea flaviverrucosa TaxID=200379 RepID=A0A1H9XWZ5_9PSEU|nr:regulatory protein RecX [Lentzea flaviverrucosa]RDI17508.1 regulatory protein [Lentzea flaviverrucosa]SES50624.1 regulatory protein [Lentzea flaviverrucosa]